MSARVFVDTNVIVYSHIPVAHEKHEVALSLLKEKLKGTHIWISTQILSEFYSAMNKNKYEHDRIVEFITAIIQKTNVRQVASETVERALYIKGRYQLSYWDSLMLSAALECGCETVYTEDLQHNQIIENSLLIINPFLV